MDWYILELIWDVQGILLAPEGLQCPECCRCPVGQQNNELGTHFPMINVRTCVRVFSTGTYYTTAQTGNQGRARLDNTALLTPCTYPLHPMLFLMEEQAS